jgi:hypothetical protein
LASAIRNTASICGETFAIADGRSGISCTTANNSAGVSGRENGTRPVAQR